MDGLIQLVAESFARHGIECPTAPSMAVSLHPAEAPLPAVLPEHNYGKRPEEALAP